MYACNDPGVLTGRQDCYGTFVAAGGILMPRVWERPDYNYDTLGKVKLAMVFMLLLRGRLDTPVRQEGLANACRKNLIREKRKACCQHPTSKQSGSSLDVVLPKSLPALLSGNNRHQSVAPSFT